MWTNEKALNQMYRMVVAVRHLLRDDDADAATIANGCLQTCGLVLVELGRTPIPTLAQVLDRDDADPVVVETAARMVRENGSKSWSDALADAAKMRAFAVAGAQREDEEWQVILDAEAEAEYWTWRRQMDEESRLYIGPPPTEAELQSVPF